jgi:hypothetical protein
LAGEVDDCVDVLAGLGEGLEVGEVGGDRLAVLGGVGQVFLLVDHEGEVVFLVGVLGEVGADVAFGAGDEDFAFAGGLGVGGGCEGEGERHGVSSVMW